MLFYLVAATLLLSVASKIAKPKLLLTLKSRIQQMKEQ